MNKRMIFILIGVLLAGCSNSSSPSITHIYAFGDSYSDNGSGLYSIFKEQVADQELTAEELKWFETYYWEGRLSNGPSAVEVLANQLKIGLTDYAVSGAKSNYSNLVGDQGLLQNAGLLGQIDKFQSGLNGEKADSAALYFIQISANDFLEFTFNNTTPLTQGEADRSVANIVDAVTQLADSGARQFMIVNSINLSKLPVVIDAGFVEDAKAFQSRINSSLPSEMEKLSKQFKVKIIIFDYTTVSDRILSNPGEYGITNLKDGCLVVTDASTEVCESPDQYYFWDEIHPTRRVHEIMGEAMAEQLSK